LTIIYKTNEKSKGEKGKQKSRHPSRRNKNAYVEMSNFCRMAG